MSEGSPGGEVSKRGAQADCPVVGHSSHQSEEAGEGSSTSPRPRAEAWWGHTSEYGGGAGSPSGLLVGRDKASS